MTETGKRVSVLTMNTLAFTVNFAIWTMFSIIGIRIKGELGLNETEFGLLIATPILTGSLVRLPLGVLTDRYGGRIVFLVQMLVVAIPTYGLAFATAVLAVPDDRPVRRSRGRVLRDRHCLHLRLVPQGAAGNGHGHLRSRQRRRRRHQPGRAVDRGRIRLARGSAGLFGRDAGDGRAVLVLHVSGSEARATQAEETARHDRPAAGAVDRGSSLALRPGLLLRLRRIRRTRPVVAQVLHAGIRARPEARGLHHDALHTAIGPDSGARRLGLGSLGWSDGDLVRCSGSPSSACSSCPIRPRR